MSQSSPSHTFRITISRLGIGAPFTLLNSRGSATSVTFSTTHTKPSTKSQQLQAFRWQLRYLELQLTAYRILYFVLWLLVILLGTSVILLPFGVVIEQRVSALFAVFIGAVILLLLTSAGAHFMNGHTVVHVIKRWCTSANRDRDLCGALIFHPCGYHRHVNAYLRFPSTHLTSYRQCTLTKTTSCHITTLTPLLCEFSTSKKRFWSLFGHCLWIDVHENDFHMINGQCQRGTKL